MVMDGPRFAHGEAIFIDGEWTASQGGTPYELVEAATGEPFCSIIDASERDAAQAVAAARRAFDHGPWPRLSHAARATFIRHIAERVEARRDDLAASWVAETGITITDAGRALVGAPAAIRAYAALADTFPFREPHDTVWPGVAMIVREPVGVVAAIIPWNAPLVTIVHKCMPALLAGCTVVLKATVSAPGAAYIFAEICAEVGLPAGVVNMIAAEREASESLVRNGDVDKVTFTGSTQAGRRIGAICADRVARCTLELGGKSAAIIADDADLVTAAASIARGATMMAGQVCAALTRVIVDRGRHDAFVDALVASLRQVRLGDPFDPATTMGPVASSSQRDRVEHFIGLGRAEGATLACGGGRPAHLRRGFFIEPTVFANVDNGMTIAQQEIFGPVLSVIPCDGEDQAVKIANDSIYGLNAAIFTNDADRAFALASRIQSGTVAQGGSKPDFGIAFGGRKQSGIGREGGAEGLRSFLEAKTVVLDRAPQTTAD